MEKNKGKLSIVATPIGNLEDMTYRAVRILKEADIIAAEDTRKAKILLNKYEIAPQKIYSHHIRNEHKTAGGIVDAVFSGSKVAVISEAGCPCVSDPGFLVIREALKQQIEPEFIPGVSSLTFAAMASGLPSERFTFYGFLPAKKGARHRLLGEISDSELTALIFESPVRVKRLVTEIIEFVGAECGLSLMREATKMHEEIIRGSAETVLKRIEDRNLKGEFVIAVSTKYKADY
ncbi:MAG: 16S rRNA (cytidine(1402)-2'-O)-methyltransferase [Victivallales bacterium]|nr:16S rRNA (cytidine(1402)-2'-O)-methyltransferase [Victivallales bacterium]